MTANENPCLASAWLGYTVDRHTGALMVRVCAWCPDKAVADAEAARMKCAATHTICDACAVRQMELL